MGDDDYRTDVWTFAAAYHTRRHLIYRVTFRYPQAHKVPPSSTHSCHG